MQLFGEVVLGLSQGSVSELLCKPKPWHMLSIKGREPFIRMQLWLTDPNNVDKLHAARAEKLNESAKRKRSALDAAAAVASPSPGSPSEFSDTADSPSSASAAKRPRVLFSTKQKEALKIAFSLDPYPSVMTTEFLCHELNLEPRSIGNWFHNHRMRLKQTHPHDLDSLLPPKEEQRPLDPLHFKLLVNQRLLELSQHGSSASPPDSPAAKSGGGGSESSGLDLSQQRQREVESGSPEADLGRSGSAASAPSSGGGGGGRSRRKPLAPQWVNPAAAWKDSSSAAGDDEGDMAAKEAGSGGENEDEVVGDVD